MYTARRKVLTMLHDRKLTVDEAEELLEAMEAPGTSPPPSVPKVELIGDSEWMQAFRRTLDKIASTQSHVLVQGESGTGKYLIAQKIHYNSRRADGPFLALNCSASTVTVDSELFGYEEGAFTGAVRSKKGMLDMASGGTLLLDMVDTLSPETQLRLDAFLQNGCFTRLGGTKPVYADVRIVAATNRDVKQLVDQEKFRSDLYYRLSVCSLEVSPLRERREDILTLAEYLVERQAERDGRKAPGISPEAAKLLSEHVWPNNVRELANTIEKAAVLCDGDEIAPEHLPALVGAT